jgi:prevent-host-death family protein
MNPTLSITRDTIIPMTDVTIRELRNQGGEVVDRAAQGEQITITRSGRPVAELRALRPSATAESLLERWCRLPVVDAETLRADVDEFLDFTL